MNVNPFSLIGDKIDKKDIFAEFKGIMGDDVPSLDFNDYTTNGWYESTGTNRTGSANVPHASDNGYLLVVSKSRTVYQYWYSTYQSLGTMVRVRKNGTWGSWNEFALKSDYGAKTVVETRHDIVFNNSDTSNWIDPPSAISSKTIYAMVFSSLDGGGGLVTREAGGSNRFAIRWSVTITATLNARLVWFYTD